MAKSPQLIRRCCWRGGQRVRLGTTRKLARPLTTGCKTCSNTVISLTSALVHTDPNAYGNVDVGQHSGAGNIAREECKLGTPHKSDIWSYTPRHETRDKAHPRTGLGWGSSRATRESTRRTHGAASAQRHRSRARAGLESRRRAEKVDRQERKISATTLMLGRHGRSPTMGCKGQGGPRRWHHERPTHRAGEKH